MRMSTIDGIAADFATHHIEGYARAAQGRDDGYFDVPLVSHITGNLWTGGCIDGVALPHDFKHVISLYPWEKYELGPDTLRLEHKLYDAAELPDTPTLYSAAGYVLGCTKQGKTLVHCQAGLNRSALVAGLALILDGMTPREVVELLREKRSPAVLCNSTFSTWLLTR